MKALSAPQPSRQKSVRKVPKPQMEKRRRDRINNSLETLRLLLLEITHDKKLRNRKLKKADILDSVVDFLRKDRDVEKGQRAERVLSVEQRPTSARQDSYHEGMRSCLLRVSHFIANKSQDLGGMNTAKPSLAFPEHPSSPGHIHRALIHAPAGDPADLPPQHLPRHHRQLGITPHPYLTQTGIHCDTRELLNSTAGCTLISDPVWRPWPQ